MNKVLFGIFLGVLFNIPTFGMNNNLGQFGGIDNNVYCNNNNQYNQTYDMNNYYNNNEEQNYYVDNNAIYINNGTQLNQTCGIIDNNSGLDMNYYNNNNVQNCYVNNDNVYNANGTQFCQTYVIQNNYACGNMGWQPVFGEVLFIVSNIQYIVYTSNNIQDVQNYNMNNNLLTGKELTIDEFTAKHGNYLNRKIEQLVNGKIKQLAEKDIKLFCEDFDGLDDETKKESIKYIKCGNCGGGLRLWSSLMKNKQKTYVLCKNKGCFKYCEPETLEKNLYTYYANLIKNEYKYYFYEGSKQFKEEHIVEFCENFSKLNIYIKQELIKYIKCDCCEGELVLEGLSKHNNKQMVRCKNKKGKCPRSKKRVLLELCLRASNAKKAMVFSEFSTDFVTQMERLLNDAEVNPSSKKVLDVAEYK